MTTKPEKTQGGGPAMAEHEQRIREALNTDGPLSDNDLRALMSDHAAMRSALEHIRRSCQASRSQTRRVRWIEVRAYGALIGDNELHRTIDLPKDGGPDTTEKLKRQMAYDRFVAHITHGLSVGILSAMLAAHQHQAPEAMTDEQILAAIKGKVRDIDARDVRDVSLAIVAARDAMWSERPRAQPAGQSVAEAVKIIASAMLTDSDYAWVWHCNIAMAAYDEGIGYYDANKAAARFLALFVPGLDTSKHPGFPTQPAGQPSTADKIHLVSYHTNEMVFGLPSGQADGGTIYQALLDTSNGDRWTDISKDMHDRWEKSGDVTVRTLYTAPQQQAGGEN